MDKQIKFSEQPRRVKIIYAAVIMVLCITAVVVGIISVANKPTETPDDDATANLPTDDEGKDDEGEDDENKEEDKDEDKEESKEPDKLTFVSPVVGEVAKYHSLDIPVFSNTLNEWRVHTGIDIAAEEGTEVFAAASGTVTGIYNDPFLGKTVEITHTGGVASYYSNLSANDIYVKVGDEVKSGARIGVVGDTSLSELADEAHLHFGVKVDGVSVNPLDYISEESKQASLGITDV